MKLATLLLIIALLGGALATSARAQGCASFSPCLMPPGDCPYVSFDPPTSYGPSHLLDNFGLYGSNGCPPFPPLGGSSEVAFDSYANGAFSSDGGATYSRFVVLVHLSAHLATVGQNGNVETIQTEILQMDISGGGLPAGVMLRESPTIASTGQCQSTNNGASFGITSFFDVFTELSIDGGQQWIPSSGSFRIDLLAGLPTKTTTWGSVKATYR